MTDQTPKKSLWKAKTGIKSGQLFAADVVGNVTELAFLKYQEKFDTAFPWLKNGFKSILHAPMKLFQKPIEAVLNLGGNFEGDDNKKLRLSQSDEQRLDGLLDATYHYATAGTIGFASMMGTEIAASHAANHVLDPKLKIKPMGKGMWMGVDAPVHTGLIVLMGLPAMKSQTESIKNVTKRLLQAAGWSEQRAENDARFTTLYILPNYATWATTSAVMAARYFAEEKGIIKLEEGLLKNFKDIASHLGIIGKVARAATHH